MYQFASRRRFRVPVLPFYINYPLVSKVYGATAGVAGPIDVFSAFSKQVKMEASLWASSETVYLPTKWSRNKKCEKGEQHPNPKYHAVPYQSMGHRHGLECR